MEEKRGKGSGESSRPSTGNGWNAGAVRMECIIRPASTFVNQGANCVFYTHAHIPFSVLGLLDSPSLSPAFPPSTNYLTRVRT